MLADAGSRRRGGASVSDLVSLWCLWRENWARRDHHPRTRKADRGSSPVAQLHRLFHFPLSHSPPLHISYLSFRFPNPGPRQLDKSR